MLASHTTTMTYQVPKITMQECVHRLAVTQTAEQSSHTATMTYHVPKITMQECVIGWQRHRLLNSLPSRLVVEMSYCAC